MSGIDLWGDDDFSADVAEAAVQNLNVGLIAADAQATSWIASLSSIGINFCSPEDVECQLILVDRRDFQAEDKLAALSFAEEQKRPPLFFLLEKGDESDCLQAFAAGADDYVHLPISPEALAVRLRRTEVHLQETVAVRQQLSESSKIAFQSMSLNAEFGRILQYMEYSFACTDYPSLARLTLDLLNEFGLRASMGIFHSRGVSFFFDDDQPRPMEQEVIESSRGLGRISDFGCRTILNYAHVTILIRNMPLEDAMRYGIIKDHICYIANGLEARTQAMITEMVSAERALRIQSTSFVLQEMMKDMEGARLEVTRLSALELEGMLENLNIEFSQLCLTGPEEARLQTLLTSASDRISALFSKAQKSDQVFQTLLAEVTKTLQR